MEWLDIIQNNEKGILKMDVEKEGRDSTSFTQMGHSLFLMFTALEVRNQNHLQWHLEGKLNYNSATKLCFFNYMLLMQMLM